MVSTRICSHHATACCCEPRTVDLFLAVLLVVSPAFLTAAAQEKPAPSAKTATEPLPFSHKVEVHRNKGGEVAFALHLEQPFLADEFEKGNYLRLQAQDRNGYLIYPKETKFQQKHAEFYGRLRGQGKARLRLTYEIVSENPDRTRRIDVRQGDIEIPIPTQEGGPPAIFRDWAAHQNAHCLNLLQYYPRETFLQYVLLQSQERYGVTTPRSLLPAPSASEREESLYDLFSGAHALQEALQRQILQGGPLAGDLNIPISQLSPPALQSLPYAELLAKKQKQAIQPKLHPIAALIPEDQYFLHFGTMAAAEDLFDLTSSWGDSLLRLFAIHARDNRVQDKLEDQLCLKRSFLHRLLVDKVVTELAITGSDPFVMEGTDVAILFRLSQPEIFLKAADVWLAEVKTRYKGIEERTFHYRGETILARYSGDRQVSSFVVRHGDHVIYANSHRAIRKIVDVFTGTSPSLHSALDYRYVTTLLPPGDEPGSGYLFVSEACLKRLLSPSFKISEKRRLQCFNNLVMLNNASLLYRMDRGVSPSSLADLVESRCVDPRKLACPHGGAYGFDERQDTCTCSLHNRLKYLTPNAELSVLLVSEQERQEYERFKQRYQAFWQGLFDPIAIRLTMAPRVKLEVCVLPLANGSLYQQLRGLVADRPLSLSTGSIASSALASLMAVHGRKQIAELLRLVPGLPEALEADPTLTDLAWLGDRLSLHVCDDDALLEVDPTRLRPLQILGGGPGLPEQSAIALALTAIRLPVYATIDVEDRDKAARLLEQLSAKILLKKGDVFNLPAAFDAYRLADYKGHALYVLSYQLYAVKVRLHVALVGTRLVAATTARTLREVIDAAAATEPAPALDAHVLLRLNRRALNRFGASLKLYGAEKERLACHNNIMSIYNLIKLYDTPIEEVNRFSEAKYGVTYYCPGHGAYHYDAGRDQVLCTVHGNRQQSRQNPGPDQQSSFIQFLEGLDEILLALRFQDDGLIATVEIARAAPARK
jgi:hypothetical protein